MRYTNLTTVKCTSFYFQKFRKKLKIYSDVGATSMLLLLWNCTFKLLGNLQKERALNRKGLLSHFTIWHIFCLFWGNCCSFPLPFFGKKSFVVIASREHATASERIIFLSHEDFRWHVFRSVGIQKLSAHNHQIRPEMCCSEWSCHLWCQHLTWSQLHAAPPAVQETSRRWSGSLRPCTHVGQLEEISDSWLWSVPVCCGHLGREPVDRSTLLLSLFFSLCNSFQHRNLKIILSIRTANMQKMKLPVQLDGCSYLPT